MLELKNIRKVYHTGNTDTVALDDISVAFREKEFVAILGTSGSGKTTCLNIIGGLDRYDGRDLIIKGKHTKDFKESDWDAYRNNSVGFIFQSYNLIMHQSIVANVELGMTLSGVSKQEKHKRALEVLKQVGLEKHLDKKPNQLSGGQMQRVAIARALANDPEILLCDEPTGALDTATSIQIMDLIKEVAKDRLVIMVAHNPDLATQYADRIIRFQDGHLISDTHPHQERPKPDSFKIKKTHMSVKTALSLSFNNLKTKKGRTFLTSFASSIGIIGIAVILSLSTGFQKQIDNTQNNTLSQFPVIISQSAMELDEETMTEIRKEVRDRQKEDISHTDAQEIYLYDAEDNQKTHTNILTDDYLEYINSIDPDICDNIGYMRLTGMNLLRDADGTIIPVTLSAKDMNSMSADTVSIMDINSAGLSSYPENLDKEKDSYLEANYELLAGNYPKQDTDLVLVVNEENELDSSILTNLGFDVEDKDSVSFDDIVGTELKLINNDDYYIQTEAGNFVPGQDYTSMYESDKSITLTITGILRQNTTGILSTGIAYSDALTELIMNENKDSEIVKAQTDSKLNVITMEEMDENTRSMFLTSLGAESKPYMIMLYAADFNDKEALLSYLDDYNTGKDTADQILYTDLAGNISEMSGSIMDATTIVLIAFAGISLVTSMIMISIITYTSVIERTKEIGILKALGARKKDITRVFNAETGILGLFSGTLGVVIAWLCTFPINKVLYNQTELENVAQLQFSHAAILVLISTVLTLLGGYIPARMAAKKDAAAFPGIGHSLP